MSASSVSTQIQLVARPVGWPTAADFRTVSVDLPELSPGEVRVANEFVSVDPYMRGRMNEVKSYVPAFDLGATLTGGAVGRVSASASPSHVVGDLVVHQSGWRDIAQGAAEDFRVVAELPGVPVSAYLGVLGMPALTAYVGLLTVAGLKEGDTVFVSGAAGAVGSMVGQIARIKGAKRVIGSAGSADKVDLLRSRYGFDDAFNYKDGAVRQQLAAAAPEGIDVYFDNVGGDHLEAALGALNVNGRAALCGAISLYNATHATAGPRNMANIVTRRLSLRGFIVSDHTSQLSAFSADMAGWLRSGAVVFDETVVDGIENTVDAFLGLMRGDNIGKMVVRTVAAG